MYIYICLIIYVCIYIYICRYDQVCMKIHTHIYIYNTNTYIVQYVISYLWQAFFNGELPSWSHQIELCFCWYMSSILLWCRNLTEPIETLVFYSNFKEFPVSTCKTPPATLSHCRRQPSCRTQAADLIVKWRAVPCALTWLVLLVRSNMLQVASCFKTYQGHALDTFLPDKTHENNMKAPNRIILIPSADRETPPGPGSGSLRPQNLSRWGL